MNPAPAPDRSEQMEIDASAKWPVLFFLGAALKWLLFGGLLQLASSIQLHNPAFLAGCEWFTHGRLDAAARNALVYGWGMNAAFAVGLWLMARLSLAALRHGGWLYVFAQNIDMKGRSGKARLSVEGCKAGTAVEVVDEGRTITADAGGFDDDFAVLQEHVYRLKVD